MRPSAAPSMVEIREACGEKALPTDSGGRRQGTGAPVPFLLKARLSNEGPGKEESLQDGRGKAGGTFSRVGPGWARWVRRPLPDPISWVQEVTSPSSRAGGRGSPGEAKPGKGLALREPQSQGRHAAVAFRESPSDGETQPPPSGSP